MQSIYHLKAAELDDSILRSIKELFRGKTINLVVSEADETEYLFRSETNRSRLLKAVEHVESGTQLREVNPDTL
jgi:antitoxin YefM